MVCLWETSKLSCSGKHIHSDAKWKRSGDIMAAVILIFDDGENRKGLDVLLTMLGRVIKPCVSL